MAMFKVDLAEDNGGHTAPEDALQAGDPTVGDGTPETAPTKSPEPSEWVVPGQTVGVAPKVKVPALALGAAGALALVLWFLAGADNEGLLTVALTLLGALGVQLPTGYLAPPAEQTEAVESDADADAEKGWGGIGYRTDA